MNINASNAKV